MEVVKDRDKKPENIVIGKAIAKAREDAGYTQETLAAALGIRQQSVGEWESGETAPRAARLALLTKLLPTLQGELDRSRMGGRPRKKGAVLLMVTESDIEHLNAGERQLVLTMIRAVQEAVKRQRPSGRNPGTKSATGNAG